MMCTMFNTAIDKFNFVTKGLEYWFEAGNIKKAHADYGQFQTKHPYQINIDDKGGKIVPVNPILPDQHRESHEGESSSKQEGDKDYDQVPTPSFFFSSIREIAEVPT